MWTYNYGDTLCHYGILGMKWGVRRYQRKDGTRTPAGKKRYSEGVRSMSDEKLGADVRRMALEDQYKKLSRKRNPSKLENAKKAADAASSLVDRAKKIERESRPTAKKLDLSKMSDQELRDKINRANLEKQYNDLFASPAAVSKGRQRTADILDAAGSILVIGSSALSIALAVKGLAG